MTLRAVRTYLSMRLKARLAWRGDWLAGAVADVVVGAAGLVMVLALFGQTPSIAGWTREEVLLCWAFAEVSRGMFWMIGRGLYVANRTYVVGGALDQLLLRPLDPLLQILLDHVHLGAWPGLLWGVGVLVWAGAPWTVGSALGAAALAALGVLTLLGVMTALSSVGFWVLHRGSAVGLAYQLTSYAGYPPAFLPWPVALILATVLPFTFCGYAPAAWLQDRPAPWWVWAQPGVGLGAAVVGVALWRVGLRRYASTGT